MLADGTVLEGIGFGAVGHAVGEVCFNTAMTGYQEILTDPSYVGQIVTFTFPTSAMSGPMTRTSRPSISRRRPARAASCCIPPSPQPSNYRATRDLDAWLKSRGVIGLAGVDTRALTALIREKGMPHAVIAHEPDGRFDLDALVAEARAWPGLDGMDLVPQGTTAPALHLGRDAVALGRGLRPTRTSREFHVVAIDYGIKRNILRPLAGIGCRVTVVPATTTADDILALKPDGMLLSNGPGDPAATGEYAVPVIRKLVDKRADLRHLPRPPDAGARARRQDHEDAPGPPRRQPSGEGSRAPARSRSRR